MKNQNQIEQENRTSSQSVQMVGRTITVRGLLAGLVERAAVMQKVSPKDFILDSIRLKFEREHQGETPTTAGGKPGVASAQPSLKECKRRFSVSSPVTDPSSGWEAKSKNKRAGSEESTTGANDRERKSKHEKPNPDQKKK